MEAGAAESDAKIKKKSSNVSKEYFQKVPQGPAGSIGRTYEARNF